MTKSTAIELDTKDHALLRALQRNADLTNAELARIAGVSESACLRRVKLMREAGVIEGFTASINQRAVGLPLNVFITLSLASQSEASLAAFEKAVAKIPEVIECYLMTGSADYLLRIVARDTDDLERIHSARLTRLAGVARVNSSIALRTVVRRAELPIQ